MSDIEAAMASDGVGAFFTLALDMLCVAGFDGYFKRLNPAWERTLGFTSQELLEQPYLDFVHPDDRENTITEASRLSEAGVNVVSFRNRYRCRDGSYKLLEWNATPVPGSELIYAIAHDTTHQQAVEHALRASEARDRAVVDHMFAGVIITDEDGRVETLNPAAETIFGYAASEVIGQNVKMLMPEPNRSEHDHYPHNFLNGSPKEIIGIRRKVEGRRKSGERFPLALTVSQFSQGGRRTFVGIALDISDQVRTAEALEELNATLAERTALAEHRAEELTSLNAELEAFTYSVSHDLKEPLRTLEAFSGFLLEDYADKLDDEGKEYLTKLGKASIRMKRLIEHLLTLSRIGRVSDPPVVLDVRPIVAGIVEGIRRTIEERHAVVDCAEDVPAVLADPTRVEQILGNLISNGIKFNDSDVPRVTIGVRGIKDGQVVLYVKDNGIGIDPQYHERIFGVFQRLHKREDYEGTGAGLAIVKRSVETLGCLIWVESEPDAGTTFLFTLPLATRESASNRIAA